ncbi:hypothetical protein [Cellulomonas fimi]|uniref:hypothetical protein n=1 Tax=Cellulomonas fimi TaxID=1708 RepID=UPI00235A23B3|nr:hypothetical protein [Cellulomonas fimi]
MESSVTVASYGQVFTEEDERWLRLGAGLLVRPTAPCRIHTWDPENGKATPASDLSAEEAMRLPAAVVAEHRSSIAMLDLDPPSQPLEPDAVPEDRRVAAWAATLMGVVVVVTGSGSSAYGVDALNGVAMTPTRRYSQAYVDLIAAKLGHRKVARLGGWGRTLVSAGYKPWHPAGLTKVRGILDHGGRFVPMDAQAVEALIGRTQPVSTGRLAALLTEHGVRADEREARLLLHFEVDEAPTRSPREWFESLSAAHQDLVCTTGEGWDPSDRGSRHQGEMSVIDALVARDATVGDVYCFLDAFRIGDRMKNERRQGGRVVTRRSAGGRRRHVRRAVKRARAWLESGGGDRRARLGRTGLATIEAAWVVAVPPEQRVALAVLAATCVRLDRAMVGLSQMQLELLTAMDGGAVMAALRAHPCVREVQTGSKMRGATVWEIVAPTDELARTGGMPTWRGVADVAGSDLAAAGILAGRERATAILIVAMMYDGREVGRAQVADATWKTVKQADNALAVLVEAGVADRQDGRYRLVTELWILAIELGVHGKVELKRAVRGLRSARSDERWAEAEARYEASRDEYDLETAGEPAAVLWEDETLADDDPLREVVAVWDLCADLPDGVDEGAVGQGAIRLAQLARDVARDDLAFACDLVELAGDVASVWASAHATGTGFAPSAAMLVAVAEQVIVGQRGAARELGDWSRLAASAGIAGAAWLGPLVARSEAAA